MTPERTCVGCRRKAPQAELVRLVLEAGTRVVVEQGKRLPGRGAYLHPNARCVDQAIRRRALQRALRSPQADVSAVSALTAAYAKTPEGA